MFTMTRNSQPPLKLSAINAVSNRFEPLLASRDSVNDVLRPTMQSEMNRTNLLSIIIANYKRAQESSRVLEELYKIVEPALSEQFKTIRYELYTLEKKNVLELSNERH
jgi:hypothetical protein